MNLSKLEYVYDVMQKDGIRFFTITDANGTLVRNQDNEQMDVADAMNDLKNFMEYNFGTWVIQLRRTRGMTAKTNVYSYTINNPKPAEQGIGSISPSPMMGGTDPMLFGYIEKMNEKIGSIQEQSTAQLIAGMQRQHELQMELMRKEFAQNKGGLDPQMLGLIGQIAGGLFGGGSNIGVSGFHEAVELPPVNEHPETMQDNTEKKRIEAAIRRLLNVDSDLATNLERLANLAETNPMTYKMAVSQLANL